ncbi:nutritionally-regulated adipose and cardiac enriched protein homolog [Dipodomys merriami]|uniref:nutritionally-regulated adipose and cardiac enriched protein homolog n=1 Tax=Dipodomys merriami TaxID=94247 RepID=UPI0038558394
MGLTKKEGDRTCPPSILRPRPPGCAPHGAPRTPKHVQFREPLEVAVHYISRREASDTINGPRPTAPSRGPRQRRLQGGSLLLRLSVCVLLGAALGLCCGQAKPIAGALEDLRAWLLGLGLRLWRVALSCWHCVLQL